MSTFVKGLFRAHQRGIGGWKREGEGGLWAPRFSGPSFLILHMRRREASPEERTNFSEKSSTIRFGEGPNLDGHDPGRKGETRKMPSPVWEGRRFPPPLFKNEAEKIK